MRKPEEGSSWKHLTPVRLICKCRGVKLKGLKPNSEKDQRATNFQRLWLVRRGQEGLP